MRKPSKKVIFIGVMVILLLIVLAVIFFLRGYHNYYLWKEYNDYFKQPNPQVEPWMSVKTVSEKFSINEEYIFMILNVSEKNVNSHITLDRFCKLQSKNCTKIVNQLNLIKNDDGSSNN
jgi:hypothetical protein